MLSDAILPTFQRNVLRPSRESRSKPGEQNAGSETFRNKEGAEVEEEGKRKKRRRTMERNEEKKMKKNLEV
jgi:hypothetical protein